MVETAELSSELGFVEADVNYIVDDGIPPVRYLDWPEEAHKAHPATYEGHRVRIHNGRIADQEFTLPTHGFKLVAHHTTVKNFFDEDEIRRVYYPETEQLIKAESGAKRVVVFDHTLRTAEKSRHTDGWVRQAVHAVHNDYTERSAPQRVRDFLPADEAEAALQERYGIVQTWRSIAPRVESEPLAMCDGRTIPEVGFIRYERRYRDRTGETYHISYSPEHRWFYFPLMTRDEALVFKVFDTDASAGVRFTAHTAFSDPTSPPDAKFRESIEMRALVFY
ncbi:MAG: methyltransferase [Rhodospirillales bacterium]|nr:methyltransferase [Rhodospirillales bacterium]